RRRRGLAGGRRAGASLGRGPAARPGLTSRGAPDRAGPAVHTAGVSVRVYLNGSIHDREGAVISVFDRGFLYGDSVYEVLRTSGGHPVDLDRHLERLERSAGAIAL